MSQSVCRNFCDHCYENDLGVMHYYHGEPVLFECRRCDEDSFEKHARRDIDTWLNGGDPHDDR